MRFSDALHLFQPVLLPSDDVVVRRVQVQPSLPQPETLQTPARELPADLDQRVRLLGEW